MLKQKQLENNQRLCRRCAVFLWSGLIHVLFCLIQLFLRFLSCFKPRMILCLLCTPALFQWHFPFAALSWESSSCSPTYVLSDRKSCTSKMAFKKELKAQSVGGCFLSFFFKMLWIFSFYFSCGLMLLIYEKIHTVYLHHKQHTFIAMTFPKQF